MPRYAIKDETMEITALSLGTPIIRKTFTAKVVSVFDHAINFKIDGTGEMAAFISHLLPDQPRDIRLDDREISLREWFYPGQRLDCDQGIVRLSIRNCYIYLNHGVITDCYLPDLPRNGESISDTCLSFVRLQMDKAETKYYCKANSFDRQLHLTLKKYTNEIVAFLKLADVDSAVQSSRKLIGLGKGLTPSGDDILLGFIAGIHILSLSGIEFIDLKAQYFKAIEHLVGGTGLISRKYLLHAISGYFSKALIDLIAAIYNIEEETIIRQKTIRVMQSGHTSGFDILTGLMAILGMETLSVQEKQPVLG